MRRPRTVTLAVPLAEAEVAAFDQLKAAAFLADDADVVRLALWRLAAQYDLRLPPDLFAIGRPPARRAAHPGRRRATPKSA